MRCSGRSCRWSHPRRTRDAPPASAPSGNSRISVPESRHRRLTRWGPGRRPTSASRGTAVPSRPSSTCRRRAVSVTGDVNSRKVLLVATTTGYQIRSFGDAAAKLGLKLVFASDRCDHLDDPWRDEAVPVRFHEPEASTRVLVDVFGDSAPDAIVAVGDRPSVLAAHLASAFGLPGNTADAAERSRNKLAARQAFRAAGLLVPPFVQVPLDGDSRAIAMGCTFPVVLKPVALSGSRGVVRADAAGQFIAAFDRVRRLLQSPDIRSERDATHDALLIESFIPGGEYAIEGVLTRGDFTTLAIFDKPDPLDGPFFEETIYVTPSRAPADVQEQMVDAVATAARALGLWHGPVHAECRVNDRGAYVLEVAARPIGGLCSRALRFRDRDMVMSLEEVLLRHALGEPLSGTCREEQAAGVMMIPIPTKGVFKGVHGVPDAKSVPGIEDVVITAKEDQVLTPLPEGRSYLGFIFAREARPALVEEAVREAHRRPCFRIGRGLPLAAWGGRRGPSNARGGTW